MKKLLWSLLIIAIVAAGSYLWLRNSHFDQTDVSQDLTFDVNEMTGTQPDGKPDLVNESVTAKQEGGAVARGSAKRIVLVPDGNLKDSGSGREFDYEFQQSVHQMVESALTGDAGISVNLGQLVNLCIGKPRTEGEIRHSLQTASFSAKTTFMFENGESRSFDSLQEYGSYVWSKHDQCRVIRTILEDDLHERITQMADNGHAIARYLYAMWRPPVTPYPDTSNMLEWLEFQEKSFEYSLLNMDEGEPLGLLAFGQSFRNINPGFFTPPHFQFTQAFFLASKKCGLKSAWLDNQINDYKARKLNGNPRSSLLERIEINSDELKELFCK